MSDPASDILIRAMEPGDLPDLTEAWNQPHAYAETLQLPFTSLEQRQARHGAHPSGHRLVALIEGKAIGLLHLTVGENRRRHVGSIGMAVHDAYTGRGVGRALLAAMIELADNWLNLTRIELTVYADNARAIGLYERFGFAREGLHRAYAWRAGAYADALAMARLRP